MGCCLSLSGALQSIGQVGFFSHKNGSRVMRGGNQRGDWRELTYARARVIGAQRGTAGLGALLPAAAGGFLPVAERLPLSLQGLPLHPRFGKQVTIRAVKQ